MTRGIATGIRRVLNTSLCVLCSCITHSQIIRTIAGNGTAGYSGDGGPATLAQVQVVSGLATDGSGNLYIGDQLNRRLRRVSASGIVTTVAGTGVAGFSGDGGSAAAAMLGNIRSVATDATGNVYIAIDGFYGERIRKINTSGIITTIAGTGVSGFSGDVGPATAAALYTPGGMAVDAAGNIYFADIHNYRIRRISTAGIITTVAGNGAPGFSGDGGPATAAALFAVGDICLTPAGDICFNDASDRIRRISSSGVINTIAGTGTSGYSGDGGLATLANITVSTGICADASGNVYFTDGSHRVRRISAAGVIATIAGTGTAGFSGDGCAATSAQINGPWSIASGPFGAIYLGDNNNYRVRNIGSGSKPSFTRGDSQRPEVCNTAPAVIDTLFEMSDGDAGQPVSWNPLLLPAHGTLAASSTGIATGGSVMPTGCVYTPSLGYTGPDTFSVVVSDCGGDADTTIVYISVISPLITYPISGADTLCVGYTAALSATATSGTWTSGNIAVATVSPAGFVTAVAAGTAIVTFNATNACGSTSSHKTITVLPAASCAAGVASPVSDIPPALVVVRASGRCIVRLGASFNDEVVFIITDMAGRVIASKTGRTNTPAEFSDFPAGCFLVSCGGGPVRCSLLSCSAE